jgi:Zn-dependent M28 family amino/carboxypeptidase
VRNLLVQVQGGDRSGEIVVVGAHYDSVLGSPGANDNATGVAGLIELARAFKGSAPRRVLRFVAFSNEEPPFFQTAEMGSRVHARAARLRGERIVAMLSLETMGCYCEDKGSQRYPPLFRFLYPDTGNFIGFVGNYRSRALVRDAIRIFRETTPFPSEGGAPPGKLPGVGWSDHSSFWQEGYPALMVTDTAPFRYPHYHTGGDTPEKIDYDRLARVISGLVRVVSGLANRD